ncbi:IS4 family transposase [Labilibaculum manganireducens]|uniref:IS4 family transposase n=1 Tax=Labilibaculum manganireducens TaxID=1940525 RepID=UPI002481D36A|nr:IS4 family transposase [Labilibaculum manganireducens]
MKNKLFSQYFLEKYRIGVKSFVRKRSLDFVSVFMFLSNLLKSSLQTELDNFFKILQHKELPVNKVTKSAFSQARQKLKYQVFVELNHDQVDFFYDKFQYRKWHNYRLVAIDGSTCRLPYSKKIVEEFGIADTSETKSPIILSKLSQAYDMLNHIIIDASLANYHVGEHELAQRHIDYLQKGDLLLFDRNYAAFWLFALLLSKGMHFCARLKVGSWKLAKELAATGEKEMTAEIYASKASKKKCKELGLSDKPIKLRFVCFELSTGEKEVLVTDIINEIEYEELENLYHQRWFVEESYKHLKSRIQIENFTGKSPLAVRQDFYAKIFTGNLTAILAFPVHRQIKENTKKRKAEYQLNFTQAVSKMKDSVVLLFVRAADMVSEYISSLWKLFSANTEIVRHGRKNPHKFRKSKRIYPTAYKTPK